MSETLRSKDKTPIYVVCIIVSAKDLLLFFVVAIGLSQAIR